MMNEAWTEQRVEQLKKLYSDPATEWSFSEIAAKLGGGVSRNAVIGKVHRLGLPLRNSGPKPQPRTERPMKQRGYKAPLSPGAPKFNPELFVCSDAADVEPRHVALLDLATGECRFPYGEGPFTFCGRQVVGEGPYCAAHRRLCSTGVPVRKSASRPSHLGQSRGGVFGRVA